MQTRTVPFDSPPSFIRSDKERTNRVCRINIHRFGAPAFRSRLPSCRIFAPSPRLSMKAPRHALRAAPLPGLTGSANSATLLLPGIPCLKRAAFPPSATVFPAPAAFPFSEGSPGAAARKHSEKTFSPGERNLCVRPSRSGGLEI